jgi:hypothetical protein
MVLIDEHYLILVRPLDFQSNLLLSLLVVRRINVACQIVMPLERSHCNTTY